MSTAASPQHVAYCLHALTKNNPYDYKIEEDPSRTLFFFLFVYESEDMQIRYISVALQYMLYGTGCRVI